MLRFGKGGRANPKTLPSETRPPYSFQPVQRPLDGISGPSQVPVEAMHSTIKIYAHSVSANYMRPWQKMEGEACTGSGFAIATEAGARHVLTNSHVVRDHQLLQVQRHDRPGKWLARLLVEGVQCDLALLAVDDERFWEDLPLQSCTNYIPTLQNVVTAVGYPVSGRSP